METLKSKLAYMRRKSKLTRKQLAEISGFNVNTITAYEVGNAKPTAEFILFYSLYFGYTLKSILDDKKKLEIADEQALKTCRYFEINPKEITKFQKRYNDVFVRTFNNANLVEFEKFLDIKSKLANFRLNTDFDLYDLALSFSKSKLDDIDEVSRYWVEVANDYTADKYALFVKSQKAKIGDFDSIDLEILELLKYASDEVKKSIITLLKAQQTSKKGGAM